MTSRIVQWGLLGKRVCRNCQTSRVYGWATAGFKAPCGEKTSELKLKGFLVNGSGPQTYIQNDTYDFVC